jgi:hypothetical protein
MVLTEAIELALIILSMVTAFFAVSWARTAMREAQQLRGEVLDSITGLRREVAVRRVIRSIDEVPPELLSPHAEEHIEHTMRTNRSSAARLVRAAIDIGVCYSEINQERNKAIGLDEDNSMSSPENGKEPSDDPESNT